MLANFCLACFSLVSILGLGLSTPTTSDNNDGQHPLESVELTHTQAKSLCASITKSQVDNGQLYQWIEVQRPQQEETQVKKHGGCFKIGFTPCLGEARAPLKRDCGFFNLFPESKDQCDQPSSSSRSKRSVSLSHGQAQHLCHTIQVIPESVDEINYVAIRVDPINPTNATLEISHISEECITWAFKPCMSENGAECNVWQKIVKPGKKCASFHSEDSGQYVRPQLHHKISSSSLPEMKQFIRCTSVDSRAGIQCKIVPVGAEISTVDEDTHSRQKRQGHCHEHCCCNWIRCSCCCGIASGAHGSHYMGFCGWCCPPRLCNG